MKMSGMRKIGFREPFPFELYLPEGNGRFPLICITPILGRLLFFDDLILERHLARFLSGQGFATAVVERPFFDFKAGGGIEQVQDYLQGSVDRNQKVLDFLLTREEIDPRRIGTLGMSFGAVVNCLWAACDPRPNAHVFIVAGGNLAEVFTTSWDPMVRGYLRIVSKGAGLKGEELKAALKKTFCPDPLEVCGSIPKEKVFMLLGLFDLVIRFRYGRALWEALGKPKTLFLPLGHYTMIPALPILKWPVARFFKQKLVPLDF